MTNELYLKRDDVLNLFEEYQPRLATHVSEFGDALEDLKFRTLESQQRWISVSERLPEKEGFYLVSIEVMENPPKITTFTGISQYIVHDEFLGEVNDFNRENVIAWMPLPQPYKAEGEE